MPKTQPVTYAPGKIFGDFGWNKKIFPGAAFFGDFNWNKKNFPRAYILPILRLFLRKLVALFHLHFSASETDASKYKGKYYDSQIRRQQLNRKL